MCENVERIRIKMDTIKQVIYILKRCKSVEEAIEKLQVLLAELESMYDVELLEDPVLYQVVGDAR